MSLFNLSIKNLKKNFNNYIMYFVSMTFAVTIYSLFKSIEYNDQIAVAVKGSSKVAQCFSAASYVIALFVFVFILYSNSFFIKRRKKELGLYSLLGMKKKTVGTMMFYETMIMGIASLIIGITFGALLSKGSILVFMRLIEAEGAIKSSFTMKVVYKSIKTFLFIFLFVSLQGASIIYRYQLIDLFKGESKREEAPKASLISAIMGIILLVVGYLIYILAFESYPEIIPLITLFTVVSGTYIFFNSIIIYYLKIKRRNRRKYYKELNMISNSQILYRAKGNSRVLATIAVLIATTLTASGFSTIFYKSFISTLNKGGPFDYVIENKDKKLTKDIDKLISENNKNPLRGKFEISVLEYVNEDEITTNVISQSQFKELAKINSMKINSPIKSDNDIFYLSTLGGKNEEQIKTLKGKNKEYNIVKVIKQNIINFPILEGGIVVSDEEYLKLSQDKNVTKGSFKAYFIENNKKSGQLTEEINSKIRQHEELQGINKNKVEHSAYSEEYARYKGELALMGTFFFIGCFTGLVFLVCTASILFFKQLSEAAEEKSRYLILRKIGVKNSQIKKSIYKQMAFIFFVPLMIGICHGGVALSKFGKLGNMGAIKPIILIAVPYTIVYSIYYLLTVKFYYKTVTK